MSRLNEHKQLEMIRTEAARWVARVYSGNASATDEEALNVWLAKDERHRREYMRTLEVWDTSGGFGLEADYEAASSTSTSWFSRVNPIGLSAVAALLLVAVVSVFMGDTSVPVPAETVQSYATDTGETRELALEDGSRVTLNTGSKLYVDFSTSMRRAILDSGEAFFDVNKDPSRPFVVTAGDQSVTVLGTRFNVYRQGSTLTVAVVEGVVAVHENLEPEKLEQNARRLVETPSEELDTAFQHYRLEAGSVGTFEKNTELQGDVHTADAESHQAWRQGVLKFADSSLTDVVEELSRYSSEPIEIGDEQLRELSISGVFHHNDLEGVLAGLEALLPIVIIKEEGRFVIRSEE